MKFWYRGFSTHGVVAFYFLSLFFLVLSRSLILGRGVFFYLEQFQFSPLDVIIMILFGTLSLFTLLQSNYAKKLYWVFHLVLLGSLGGILLENFDKFIFITIFLYMVVSYIVFLSLCEEIDQAYFNPRFNDNDLQKPFDFKVSTVLSYGKDKRAKAIISNIDNNGMYCYLPETSRKLKGNVTVESCFEDHLFSFKGHVVSASQNGVGIKVQNSSGSSDWSTFYDIMTKRNLIN